VRKILLTEHRSVLDWCAKRLHEKVDTRARRFSLYSSRRNAPPRIVKTHHSIEEPAAHAKIRTRTAPADTRLHTIELPVLRQL
jgi:hypothetical protein